MPTMQKRISILCAILCMSIAYVNAATNTLEVAEINVEKGATETVLPISLINGNSITGFQFDLKLPDGISVATDEEDICLIEVARTTSRQHDISTYRYSDGTLRILCSSMSNATFSGNSGVVLNITLDISESLVAGAYNIKLKNIVLSDIDANRYTMSDVTSLFTIAELKPVTITAKDFTMVYGDQVPKLTYKSDGAELKGTPTLSCSATSTSPVGTYPITVSKGSVENKNVSFVNGTLTIVKAPLTISAGNYTKKQGEENPKFTATYSGFKNGETSAVLTKQPTFTTDVVVSTAPGQYVVKVSGAEAKNYEISYVDGTMTVTEADKVTITANNITMVYGDAVPELTYTSGGAALQGTPVLSCSATSKSPVGTYPITINKGSVENYNVNYVEGTLTIVKAPLTISAGNYTKKQGMDNPVFTASYFGFRNGETSAVLTKQPTFTTDVVASTAPGQYAVKVSGADAKNYEISYVNGTLTVTEADKVTITANNITMVYGDAVPELTYTSGGAALQGTPVLSCSATSKSPVGTYPITISKGSVENYNVSYVNGTLTIVKAPLTISAGNYTKKQGEENPKFTATYSGFKNGETSAVLTKQPTFTTDVVASTAPGQYAVKVSGAEAKNYEISYVNGTLTVTEADKVTVIANNITMVYGDAVPNLTYTCGDELVGVPVLSCSATSQSPVGTYPITISKGSVENYNVSYVEGTLTIVKAPLTISAGNYTKKQGEENPKFTATYSGFKNGETSAVLTKQPTFTTDVTASTVPGQYAVKVSGAEAKNYDMDYVDGSIIVMENSDYITFQDVRVERICIANWDINNDGLFSKEEAAAVTDLGDVFRNTYIKTFDELQFFLGLKIIPALTFNGCSDLESIRFPNSLTTIKYWAFSGCRSLKSLIIPASVTSVSSDGGWDDCVNLESIMVENGNPIYDSRGNCNAIIETATNKLVLGCKSTINVPNTIIKIGPNAFYNCKGLSTIVLPESLEEIGEDAFVGCTGLKSLYIPSKVRTITDGCFVGCLNLQTLEIAPNNRTYDSRDNCNAIIKTATNELVYGNSYTTIPSTVTTIGNNAFKKCTDLKLISIPVSVRSIGGASFGGCSELTSIVIPDSCKSIGDFAFAACLKLVSVEIPDGLVAIGEDAFARCTSLTSIELPASIETIGSSAFMGCEGLAVVNVHWDVPLLVNGIFDSGCIAKATLYVPKGTKALYESAEVWKDFGTIIESSAIIADDITIEYGDDMPLLTYSSDVEVVGTPVLSCSATSTSPVGTYPITVSKGNVENKNVSFVNGTLTIVKAPLTISAGNYTKKQGEENPKFTATYSGFKNGETSAVLTKQPTFTTDVTASTAPGQYAVKVSGAEAKNYEISYVDGTMTVTENIVGDYIVFTDAEVERICLTNWDTNNDGLFSKEEAAAVTDIGTTFQSNSSIKTFDELQYFTGLTVIPNKAFYSCRNLKSVRFPKTITTIEADAFYYCTLLKSLTLPSSVTSFKSSGSYGGGYKYCTSLETIVVEGGNQVYDSRDNCNAVIQKSNNTLVLGCMNTVIPNTVNEIGAYAFDNCYGLLKIEVPESVTKINSYGFSTCIAATEVNLPNSLTYISGSAFYNCESITSLKIPGSVTYIGSTSFAECFSLKEIELPASVNTIGNNAFGKNTALEKMTVAWETPLFIKSGVFSNTDITKVNLYVPKGTKALYESAEVWKDFGSIIEDPSIVADDITIEYGDDMPLLTYSSDVEVVGTPVLSCSATSTSPVGTYPITVSKGNVENKNVSFVNGTLTIVKAPLTISAGNYTKKQGEENPKFTATYSGFKNGETSAVLTKQPTFTTDVTASTAPGQYTLKVSGAEAQNYEIGYIDGSITVTEDDNYIVFQDVEVERICLANWDVNNDGFLSVSEAKAVVELGRAFHSNPNIRSFDELQYFTGLNKIETNTFTECTSLESVRFPRTITIVEEYAFRNCTNLKSLVIPASVVSFGVGNCYNVCTKLESIVVEEGNLVYDSRDNCDAIIQKSTNALILGCRNTVIPNTVLEIGSYAFDNCVGLLNIDIPESVKVINSYAFRKCTEAKEINLPDSLYSIGYAAFSHCTSITSLRIPNSVTSIEGNAFGYNTALANVIVEWDTPLEIASRTFSNVELSNVSLYVPEGTKALYEEAKVWKDFGAIIEMAANIVPTDADAHLVDVYSLTGLLVKKQAKVTELNDVLPKGVYIVGGRKVVIK